MYTFMAIPILGILDPGVSLVAICAGTHATFLAILPAESEYIFWVPLTKRICVTTGASLDEQTEQMRSHGVRAHLIQSTPQPSKSERLIAAENCQASLQVFGCMLLFFDTIYPIWTQFCGW